MPQIFRFKFINRNYSFRKYNFRLWISLCCF